MKTFSITASLLALALLPMTVSAGSLSCNFNSGLPAKVAAHGNAVVEDGILKLVTAKENQLGSVIVQSLDEKPVSAFTVSFKALIGDGGAVGADGIGFYFSPNLNDSAFSEARAGDGLNIVFATFQDQGEPEPGLKVLVDKKLVTHVPLAVEKLRKGEFVEVVIKLDRDGTLDVTYDREALLSDFSLGATKLTGRFAFAARTGSAVDNHFIDDLKIVTHAGDRASLERFEPSDDNASPSPIIRLVLINGKNVAARSVRLILDGAVVEADVTKKADNSIVVEYQPEDLLPPGSEHEVGFAFSEGGAEPAVNHFTYRFKISELVALSSTHILRR